MRSAIASPLLLAVCLLASGCDQLGIETPAVVKANRDADAKAIGGACRHAGRAIEDCYTLNKKFYKAAMYAGWREMNDYMRENKLESVAPLIKPEAEAPKVVKAPKPAESAPPPEVDEEDVPNTGRGKHDTAQPLAKGQPISRLTAVPGPGAG